MSVCDHCSRVDGTYNPTSLFMELFMGTHLFHADTLESVISMQAMRLLEEKYSSLFFHQNDLLLAEYVLDVICGSGTWALDVGQKYPHVQVIGIDSRPAMIRYAQAQCWFY